MQPQWPPSFHAVTAALTNPSSYVSAYYAQAYAQKKPATTAEGYSLSSTYVPGSHAPLCANQAGPSTSYRPAPQRREHESPIAWYQPGSCRCTYKQCNFTGSQKALEVHMMDRHLIYPRGWNDRKKRDDWDADHSLKGKPLPIQGTNIVLDSPELLQKWIAERKGRWPTQERVQEKKRKLDDAIAYGQVPFDALSTKRRRGMARNSNDAPAWQRGGRSHRGRGKPAMPGRAARNWDQDAEGRADARPASSQNPRFHTSLPAKPVAALVTHETSSESDDDDDEPEVVSSKPPPESVPTTAPLHPEAADSDGDKALVKPVSTSFKPFSKPLPRQPQSSPRNPFASRPNLLQNVEHSIVTEMDLSDDPLLAQLLAPEIRMTVSNLSQAIRFLVDNEFLQGVELRPGQADETMIQVVGSQTVEFKETSAAGGASESGQIIG